jgi:hypothetical protein
MQDILGRFDDQRDWLAKMVNRLHRIPPDDWVALTQPDEIDRMRTMFHAEMAFLSPLGDPFQDGRAARLWAHFGDVDVLRIRYAVGEWQIEVLETGALTLVWVEPAPLPGPDLHARIQAASTQLLRWNPKWFFFPGRPGETLRFSTDSTGKRHDSSDGDNQYDGGIVGGRMYFVRYYTLPMTQNPDPTPPLDRWLRAMLDQVWKRRPAPPPKP